jgi:hypothetical protein
MLNDALKSAHVFSKGGERGGVGDGVVFMLLCGCFLYYFEYWITSVNDKFIYMFVICLLGYVIFMKHE